ncbi:MAG: 2-oxo acid dehydrogenase subunit E2 [Verrucomicrobia bacterium]|nr:2-oxo acid dehydrogenase subunit E2 [Verrucomicrobiota bacterium]
MQKNIHLPQVELNMESITVVRWLVKEGDHVAAEQPILEIETQKAVAEAPSSDAGYVRKLCVKEGDTIGEKALLCILTDTKDESFEDVAALLRSADSSARQTPLHRSAATPDSEGGAIRAAPAARKLARDLGVDLATVNGTGPDGRITVEDVQRMQNAESRMKDEEQWTPLLPSRLALIAQMQKSLAEIPQFHVARQMEVMPLMAKAEGITFTHRLIRAAAAALAKHPSLRTVMNGHAIRAMPVSVAVAMETPNGLIAPALRHADQLTLGQIAAQTKELRVRAEAGRLKREEWTEAPFAISNLGMFGVDFFNAFVFHGQTAVLAVGRATEGKAWFNLAVDHRIVDGAEAARFFETLQQEIQKGVME